MTARVPLPTETRVQEVIEDLRNREPGHPPTAISVAGALGLTNATFWRHFPALAREVADARHEQRGRKRPPTHTPDDSAEDDRATLARLRTANANLENQLRTAAEHIQHLTLENRNLRDELELVKGVRRL